MDLAFVCKFTWQARMGRSVLDRQDLVCQEVLEYLERAVANNGVRR